MHTIDWPALQSARLTHWQQTASTKIANAAAAVDLINRVGIATLYPVSTEIPNLFHAYVGDPHARTEPQWDSPSGQVYGWRWTLGRQRAAWYATVVRNKPSLVSWALLPALLRLRGERRTPDELYDAGLLSDHAYRIAQALEEAGGVLSTGELRKAANFPTGKAQRAAFLKAIAELDTRLLLAKSFADGDDDMRHGLVAVQFAEQTDAAEQMTEAMAMDALLAAYLLHAAYVAPTVLAKHLKLDEAALRAGCARAVDQRHAVATELPGYTGACYVWRTLVSS